MEEINVGKKIKGSWRKTKNGRIEYRFYFIDENGIRRMKSITADSEDECLDRADEFMWKLSQKTIGIDLDATIPDILHEKVENDYKKNFTGEQGYDRNLQTIAIIERSIIGHIPIRDVKERHIEIFLQNITSYSNNVIRKIYSMVRLAFKMAQERKVISHNFFTKREFRCPNSDKPDKVVRALTEDEQKRLVKALEEHKVPYGRNSYKNQILIELYGGLRMGEINALRPEDIHFKDGYLHVSGTISRGIKSRPFIKMGTKTNAGVRDIPISKPLKKVLERSLEEMKDNPEGLIFYDYEKGGVVETYQVNSFYQRLCKKAGVEYNGQHALRHTFATRCIESGIPAIVLKNWLGHTDIHITLDTYSDVFDRMNLGAISKYEKLIDELMDKEEEE